jgi:hypothetical protein
VAEALQQMSSGCFRVALDVAKAHPTCVPARAALFKLYVAAAGTAALASGARFTACACIVAAAGARGWSVCRHALWPPVRCHLCCSDAQSGPAACHTEHVLDIATPRCPLSKPHDR